MQRPALRIPQGTLRPSQAAGTSIRNGSISTGSVKNPRDLPGGQQFPSSFLMRPHLETSANPTISQARSRTKRHFSCLSHHSANRSKKNCPLPNRLPAEYPALDCRVFRRYDSIPLVNTPSPAHPVSYGPLFQHNPNDRLRIGRSPKRRELQKQGMKACGLEQNGVE